MTTKTTATKKATKTTKTAKQPAINPFIAALAKQTESAERATKKAIQTNVAKLQTKSVEIADKACADLGVELSTASHDFYGLLVASYSTESIAKASGDELAQRVTAMIESYYSGDKEAVQPIIDAANIWVVAKHKGEAKTDNLPNNLRLLVTRKSVLTATGEDTSSPAHDYKLTLSVDKATKQVVIKEAPLKKSKAASAAQKVFKALTGLDTLDLDELVTLVATDAALVQAFSMAASLSQAGEVEATKEALESLETRALAASKKEDELFDAQEKALESKLELADQLGDKLDELAVNEQALTSCRVNIESLTKKAKNARKADVKEQLADDLEVANAQLSELLGANEAITSEVAQLEKALATAQKELDTLAAQYDNQARLAAEIGKKASQVKTALVH